RNSRTEACIADTFDAHSKQFAYEFFHARTLTDAFQHRQYLAARKVRVHGSGKTVETLPMVPNLQRTGDDRQRTFGSVGEKPEKPRRRASRRTVVDADIMRPRGLPEIRHQRDRVNASFFEPGAGFAHRIGIDRHECDTVGPA